MSNANPYIIKLKNINLLSGLLIGEMSFQNGLNIVSGENGTGKTKLLQLIKMGTKEYANSNTNRIVIFNPKRNAEKQNLDYFITQPTLRDFSSSPLCAPAGPFR